MTIERQYLKQLKSIQESEKIYYLISRSGSKIFNAMSSNEYALHKEEYSKVVPIKISSDLNTEFNAIVVSKPTHAIYHTQIAIYPLKYINSIWRSLQLDYFDTDMSKEEFMKIVNSNSCLTQEQLDTFKEIFQVKHSEGKFVGVALLPEEIIV